MSSADNTHSAIVGASSSHQSKRRGVHRNSTAGEAALTSTPVAVALWAAVLRDAEQPIEAAENAVWRPGDWLLAALLCLSDHPSPALLPHAKTPPPPPTQCVLSLLDRTYGTRGTSAFGHVFGAVQHAPSAVLDKSAGVCVWPASGRRTSSIASVILPAVAATAASSARLNHRR